MPEEKSRRCPARAMMPDIFKVLADGHDSGGALVVERGNVVGVVSVTVLADGHHARAAFLSSGCRKV